MEDVGGDPYGGLVGAALIAGGEVVTSESGGEVAKAVVSLYGGDGFDARGGLQLRQRHGEHDETYQELTSPLQPLT